MKEGEGDMRIIITDDNEMNESYERDFCGCDKAKELIDRLSKVSGVKILVIGEKGREEYLTIPETLIEEAGLEDEELMVVSSEGKIEICPAEDF